MAYAFLALLVVLVAASIIVGRRRHMILTTLITAAVLAIVWGVTLLTISKRWRNVDGFVDCYQSCTTLQVATGVVFSYVPIAMILLLSVAVWSGFIRGRRKRPAREP